MHACVQPTHPHRLAQTIFFSSSILSLSLSLNRSLSLSQCRLSVLCFIVPLPLDLSLESLFFPYVYTRIDIYLSSIFVYMHKDMFLNFSFLGCFFCLSLISFIRSFAHYFFVSLSLFPSKTHTLSLSLYLFLVSLPAFPLSSVSTPFFVIQFLSFSPSVWMQLLI